MSPKIRRISVSLYEPQIDFLRKIARKAKEQGCKKMSACKVMGIFAKALIYVDSDIVDCQNEQDIEKKILACLKKSLKGKDAR